MPREASLCNSLSAEIRREEHSYAVTGVKIVIIVVIVGPGEANKGYGLLHGVQGQDSNFILEGSRKPFLPKHSRKVQKLKAYLESHRSTLNYLILFYFKISAELLLTCGPTLCLLLDYEQDGDHR